MWNGDGEIRTGCRMGNGEGESTRPVAHGGVERSANDGNIKRGVGLGQAADVLQVCESGDACEGPLEELVSLTCTST